MDKVGGALSQYGHVADKGGQFFAILCGLFYGWPLTQDLL